MFLAKNIQPIIKEIPPNGVTGIKQYFNNANSPKKPLLIAIKYKDPENKTIPSLKNSVGNL